MLLNEMFGSHLSGMKYTDRNAPSPGDMVMTPDGKGVVIDSRQNNDGYYVFFTVEFIDGELDGLEKNFHIREIKKIPAAATASGAVKYLDDVNEPGTNFDDHA